MLEFERLERHPPAMHRGHAPFPHPNLQEMERGDFAGIFNGDFLDIDEDFMEISRNFSLDLSGISRFAKI